MEGDDAQEDSVEEGAPLLPAPPAGDEEEEEGAMISERSASPDEADDTDAIDGAGDDHQLEPLPLP